MRYFKIPRDWILVFCTVASVFLFFSHILPRFLTGFWATYVLQPLVWGLLAYYIYRLPRYNGAAKIRLHRLLVKIALGVAFLQIYLMVVSGFLDKFGRSPNSFTIKAIIINLVFVAADLLATEFSRAWLLNRLLKKPSFGLPIFIALLYTFFSLPLSQFPIASSSLEEVTQFLGSSLLPQLLENLFASVLAMWGGALPAIAYRGTLQAFSWFCPILPDLNWAMKALTGTVVPLVGLAVIQEMVAFRMNPARAKREGGQGLLSWIVLSTAAVILVWFSVGVFPVRPTVIYSGSMRPNMEVGDIVIVAKTNPDRLKTGDVIQFRTPDIPIPTVHRIIDSKKQGGVDVYITQGDANSTPDTDPVYPEQLVGKVVYKIPRAGWASITIRQLWSEQESI